MMPVSTITPHLSSIQAPPFLAAKPLWLIWRFEQHDGEAKPRKVPYYANGAKRYGVQGRLEDRQQLVTFEAARTAAAKRGFTGIGHACLDGDFTVIDFDKCAPNGKLDPVIEALSASSYAEYSPSGEGIHLYAMGNLNNNLKSIATAGQFGIELFSTKGFLTFTGNALEIVELVGNQDTVAPASAELTTLIHQRFGNQSDDVSMGDQPPLGASRKLISEALDVLYPDMGHADWLKVGMAIHHETNGEGFDLWDAWSATGSKYPGDGNLQGRWDSFGRNPGKQVTARSLFQLANSKGARISYSAVSMEDFEALDKPLEDVATSTKRRFEKILIKDFAKIKNTGYLIKGLLPKAELGVIYGATASGKTFITLDLAMAIARGIQWRGLRTKQGSVVYIVAEGAAGFRNRAIAYAKHHNIDFEDIPLEIIDAAPNLLIKEDALAIRDSILASGPKPSLVVVDTLAQSMAGANENASEDMGKALAHCKGIHKATGALVLLVHHSGKDVSKGARGWSGMRAAADVELEVTRTPTARILQATKQKDGADFQEWGFDLEVLSIGHDDDGDAITSCVVIEADVPVKVEKVKPLGGLEMQILNAVSVLSLSHTAGIERTAVLDQAMVFYGELSVADKKSKRGNLNKALKRLADRGNASFWLTEDDTVMPLAENNE